MRNQNLINRPVKQHWVPRFYLKHFSTPKTRSTKNPQIWVFSKHDDDGEPGLVNTRNICVKRYLYSPESGFGERDWALEAKLGDLENFLSSVWNSLADEFVDFRANEALRKAVALFIAVMHLRHPSNLDFVTDLHKELVSFFEQAPVDSNGVPVVDSVEINGTTVRFDASDWKTYKTWDESQHHKFFVSIVQSESVALATMLLRKRWSIIFSKQPVFITSDNPVSKQHQSKTTFGFGSDGTIVTFPISPTRLLVMDDRYDQPGDQYYPLNGDDPGPYNLLIWRNGSLIISHRHPDLVLKEIIDCANRYEREHA